MLSKMTPKVCFLLEWACGEAPLHSCLSSSSIRHQYHAGLPCLNAGSLMPEYLKTSVLMSPL